MDSFFIGILSVWGLLPPLSPFLGNVKERIWQTSEELGINQSTLAKPFWSEAFWNQTFPGRLAFQKGNAIKKE